MFVASDNPLHSGSDQTMAKMEANGLLTLPEDAATEIMKRLDFQSLLSTGLVCKSLYRISSSEVPWMTLCTANWGSILNLLLWRSSVASAKSLYRLLKSFSKLVGLWKAQELYPRGGVLYIQWGQQSLNAWRIWSGANGDIILRPLFKINGEMSGSHKTYLLTGDSEVEFPVELKWSSKDATQFYLHLSDPCAANLTKKAPDAVDVDTSWQVTINLQMNHLKTLVKSLGPDRRVLGSDDEIFDEDVHLTQEQLLYRFLDKEELADQNQQSKSTGEWIRGGLHFHSLQRFIAFDTSTSMIEDSRNLTSTSSLSTCRRINKSSYARLIVDTVKPGQELAGIWSAIYGPHGLELVAVSYTSEEIIATKLLGDPNVPSGEVTFKALLSSATRESQLPQELAPAILRMYRGWGRIAQHGYENPKWVPGQLLVQNNHNMAFLWGDVNFLIHFNRVNLESLESGID
eukprot:TRINITY_DN22209_c0_g1_i1.p1 TRINITY_DN22209_c0_g1~~TRINITY_DN22209_c0_g1_i1.p1  ORF type:complete len:459 (-),score=79.04 TRINITY_DN22209_c0_g1_i1:185-1561(-)